MKGMPLVKFVDLPDEIAIAYGKEFVRSNYRLTATQPIQLTKEGKPVKVYSNLLGIVKITFGKSMGNSKTR